MRLTSSIFLIAAAAATAAQAAAPAAPVAKPATANIATPVAATAPQADIARVETYINSLTTIAADFSQIAADGKTSKGKFYLSRPGKMRWQYDAPAPIILVSDGKAISYYDVELDQLSYVDIDDTLAGFLAQKDIRFDSAKTKLTKFEAANGTVRATLVQKNKPAEGSLTLEFSDNPLQIQRMEIVDATGQTTRVSLANATFGDKLDKKLFIFVAPKSARQSR